MLFISICTSHHDLTYVRTCRNGGMLRSSLSTTGTGTWWSMSGCMHICITMGRRYVHTCTYVHVLCVYMYVRYASKKNVRKVSNGREITFEVLRGAREMYNNMYHTRTTVGSSRSCCQENQCHVNNLPAFL